MFKFAFFTVSLFFCGTFAQTYQLFQGYDDSSCGGQPVGVVATLINTCYPIEDDFGGVQYEYDTCNATVATSSVYAATQCTGVPDEYEENPVGTCLPNNDLYKTYTCVTEIPQYEGNFITVEYYNSLDCTGDLLTVVISDYKFYDCFGGIQLECDNGDLVMHVCDDDACNVNCVLNNETRPSGTCTPDDNVPGTSNLYKCTSSSSAVIVSFVMIVLAAVFTF